ncbi:MAG TPA: MBL fold metallo-hydrolase [Kofleriaceae bacterium]|nr:MBL fold metallo-hydrolase [Kofleriaceae bacterium]
MLLHPAALHDLGTLDRALLYVFVAGPGNGEGLAVALPHTGWLVVDGCHVADEKLPLLEILETWRDPAEAVDCLALTHPHRDHAAGIRRLIEETRPRYVALSAPPSNPTRAFAVADDPRQVTPTTGRQRISRAVDALRAIRRYWEECPQSELCLVDGEVIPTSSSRVTVKVCAPQLDHLEEALERAARSKQLAERPNEISAVIEVTFGATRLVLGSDLPAIDYAGKPIRGGWADVLSRYVELGQHKGLKLPHHGSRYAFHPDLHTEGQDRAWWIAPFNQGQRLPPMDADGIPGLVSRNKQVLMTSLPRSREEQEPLAAPAVFSIADLPALFSPANAAAPSAMSSSPGDLEPLDPIWCVAFDDRNAIAGAWRGRYALSLVE